ncbi:NAD(P)H-dependent oxidoreductase [Pseudoalteromonas sp. MT33b]|uniref:NAD(P)H-dependent oxidoreductase n=2 Tax=Pseudoalteromonas TaxID=53246 RepID=UPI001C70E3D4|nr:NAD(P)H-dependent oxidoreductase [Pseudoalteromonas sp. MT33b]
MKNIILVNGNPKKNSFSSSITDKYAQAARKSANIRIFNLPEMDFDPNLMCGYDDDQPLAPCLKEFSKSLHWAYLIAHFYLAQLLNFKIATYSRLNSSRENCKSHSYNGHTRRASCRIRSVILCDDAQKQHWLNDIIKRGSHCD